MSRELERHQLEGPQRQRHRATVDLGTPVGVDNVDAYRLMIQSLRLK